MSLFQQAKILAGEFMHLGKDALHIYVGLTLFLGAALLLRWPLSSWRPWAVAVAGAVAGELWDLYDIVLEGRRAYWSGHVKDVLNTCFWPTILVSLARYSRVFARKSAAVKPRRRSA